MPCEGYPERRYFEANLIHGMQNFAVTVKLWIRETSSQGA